MTVLYGDVGGPESGAPGLRRIGMASEIGKRFAIVLGAGALVAATALVGAPSAQAGDAKCGEEGQPMCPLQEWMEKNMQAALDANDLAKLATLLDQAAAFAPDPKWHEGDKGWEKIAKDGAAKATAGDLKAVQATCKSCHSAWRKQYKAQHRPRALPKSK